MISDSICSDCSWRVATTHYVDRQGRASRLCGRCLGRAVERRAMEVKLESMHDRLRAQQAQYRRLEQDLAWVTEQYQNALA